MKVMLFFPGKGLFSEPEPLNLEILAGMIPDCDVRIVDLRFEERSAKQFIQAWSPDIVGTSTTTSFVYQAQDILKAAKEVDQKIFTMVGGSHPSSWPIDFNLPYVDAIVIGQGEDAFKELVENLAQGKPIDDVDGIARPVNGELTFTKPRALNKDLDSYPPPRRDLTRKHHHRYRYVFYKDPTALISTSRGCPNRCSFCAIWRLMNGKYITRSPENVVEELANIKQSAVRFADGNTFGNIKRVHALCDLIIESGIKKRLVMDISTNIIVKNADLIEKMRRAGLFAVVLGIESLEDEKLDELNKRCTVSEHDEAVNILQKNGISIAGNFLIDPSFEPKDFDKVAEYIIRRNIEMPVVHVTTPLPGTILFDEQKDRILTDNYDYFDLRNLILPTKIKRKKWWKLYQKLNRLSLGIAFKTSSDLKPIVYKPLLALATMKNRKNYLLKKKGRKGTYLHKLISERESGAS
jgi:radical SAM superfamily enzyme YgiQ (UPF0313 family)